MHYRKKPDRKRNQGFSLFTVIISMAFIGILAMLVLYIAMANFRMKVSDLKHKDDFYTAEQALEEIRIGLQEDVGDAMSDAYTQVMENYSQNASSDAATLDELRQSNFREQYVKKLTAVLMDGTDREHYDLSRLTGYIDYLKSPEFDGSREILSVVTPDGKSPVLEADLEKGVLLRNLKVIYVDSQGGASIIETDIRLSIPDVPFPTPSTLPDLMNMIVVAEGGIVCEAQNSTLTTSIKGSVYAGTVNSADMEGGTYPQRSVPLSLDVKPGAHVLVSSGERFVCRGEIQVGQNGSFHCASEVTLWAQGVALAEAEVQLLGKTCLADDLTVESGNRSSVTIAGEYYGYGSPSSARDESCHNKNYYDGWTERALSSAIVINGKNTILDLSGVQKIMLAGKSYLAGSKVTGAVSNTERDIMMGESLTVKGTQLAYLVPSELLYDGTVQNPMTYSEYLEKENEGLPVVSELMRSESLDVWNGKCMADLGVDTHEPIQKVFYNNNSGEGHVYFYLNFKDDSSAAAYMQNYYSGTMKEHMDQYLSFYFGEESGIRINNAESYLRYITNGNVLSYNGEKKTGSLTAATDAGMEQMKQEQIGYQNMWYSLNRKMISSYDLLNEKVEDPNGTGVDEKGIFFHDERDETRSVYDNLVNEAEMLSFIENHHNMANYKGYEFRASSDDGDLTAVMVHNGKTSSWKVKTGEESEGQSAVYEQKTFTGTETEFVIDETMAGTLRLVVCTGNVRIRSGVKFQGIIMAKGTITLESGAELLSAPLDAARVFQAQTVAGLESPKDFFWEGERYVPGNTISSNQGNTSGYFRDVYNLAECVNYENWKKK